MAKSQSYHLKMPEDGYEALQAIAAKEKRVLADVIREALEEYTARKGHKVSFIVERGGNRRGDKDEEY